MHDRNTSVTGQAGTVGLRADGGQPACGGQARPGSVQSWQLDEQFGEIYEQYFAGIYAYVAGRLGRDIADDLAAETFLTAFRIRRGFDPERGELRPWLFGIATNLIARYRRAEVRRYLVLAQESADEPADDPQDQIMTRLRAEQMRKPLALALAQLSEGDRHALLLVALADLSYAEAAIALGIPPGTVGSRLNRARRTMRAALGGQDPLTDSGPAEKQEEATNVQHR